MRVMFRRVCAVCGQKNVAHTYAGEPVSNHTRGKRHCNAKPSVDSALRAEYLKDTDATNDELKSRINSPFFSDTFDNYPSIAKDYAGL